MKRRSFIKTAAVLATALTAKPAWAGISFQDTAKIRSVLRGGKSFYQDAWQILDVGILESGRLIVGPVNSIKTAEIIDVSGKIVSPGFIDILADNAANPQRTYKIFEKYKVGDGVTTALQMHGGSSNTAAYPTAGQVIPASIKK